jgi:hypothetical protein
VRAHFAAVHLDQGAHQREPDAEAAVASIGRRRRLEEQVEDLRQELRLDADSVVLHADLELATVERRLEPDPSAGLVNLAALFNRLVSAWASRVWSAYTMGSVGSATSSLWLRARSSPGSPRARVDHRAEKDVRALELILRRLMRETSSRSSISFTMCCTWR